MNDYSTSTRIKNAMYGIDSNPDHERTVTAFREIAKASRKRILAAKQRAEEDKSGLFEIYSQKLATEKTAEIDANLVALIAREKNELRTVASDIMAGKRSRFNEIALTPPTNEQIRMLQALQLRANRLTCGEIASVAETMADNHQALRSLAAIAEQSGIRVVIPASIENTEETLAEVEAYLAGMVDAVDAKNHTYRETEFFFDGDLTAGYFKAVADAMDGTGFIAEQKKAKPHIEVLGEAAREALSQKDYEKSKRIQKFIEENDARLLSSAERLERDVTAAINGPAADDSHYADFVRRATEIRKTIPTFGIETTGAEDDNE